jgi:hypothetical protein
LNGLSAVVFQVQQIFLVTKRRVELFKLGETRTRASLKLFGNIPLYLFLLFLPVIAAGFAAWYAIGMSGIPSDYWLPS